jgi:exopolysaccharide/PEP-CTERM locus tyrosine autokinase
LGKIFDALEKFSKERGVNVPDRIKHSDYEALMQFDDATGKIDIEDPKIARDPNVLKRLMTYRLINEDGTLTPAGRSKYEELKRKHGDSGPARPLVSAQTKEQIPVAKETSAEKPGGLSASDWDLLVNYDRQTGNLLKYDPETGQLDDASRSILQDPATVQRLIDNQMILPGGWLTPEAKRECERLEEQPETKQTRESVKPEKSISADKPDKAVESPEPLNKADMDALLLHDHDTRKLDMSSPLIAKDPAIVKRLLESNMIESDGKLTPRALVRCRALTQWNQKFEEKESVHKKSEESIGKKLQTITEKSKTKKAPEEAGEKKLKIISLKADEPEAKDGIKPSGAVSLTSLATGAEAEGDSTKTAKQSEKTDAFITGLEAKTDLPETAQTLPERKFTLGKAPEKYARREIEKDLVTLMNPQSFEAEQFKILRTNLLFPESGKTPRSVMVTSAVPGEGKSFVAANLAVSVARHVNWNVLLIDSDLRRPSIHKQFGFQNLSGLSNYLANGTDLEPLLLKTGIENLTILPAGKSIHNPSELLSSERMTALLEEVAERYNDRLIILDSPPPKLTAESGALARYVEGILVVVKYNSTPKDLVSELIGKLGRDKILGAVVNKFDAGTGRYHKKYYGGGYYSS